MYVAQRNNTTEGKTQNGQIIHIFFTNVHLCNCNSEFIAHWIILTLRNYYHDVKIFSKAIIRAALKMKFILLPKPVM